ncbi:hypothetical protein EG68_09051 [Paragonimus skrjabini miyazakii]|uniref:Uncharacterized protein n=1 Tax=Paragonimus skrjabini miyazakii TaxID=59628 RepID=A0A8S9YEF6_9TREM|nr:hypothetical protein EG68_09051 [Paragonimus skrjabini miyazakii]
MKHPAACVAFVIMDHDMLLSDDLEGIAFVPLASLFEAKESYEDRENQTKLGMRSTRRVLPVLRSISQKYSALHILGERTDAYAQEVHKRWHALEKDSSH